MGNTPFDLHCPIYRRLFAHYRPGNMPIGAAAVAKQHELRRTGRFRPRSASQTFRGDVLRAMSLGTFEVACRCGRTFWTSHKSVLGLDGPTITECPVHGAEPHSQGLCAVCDHLRED